MEINRKRVARRLASGLVAGALALGGLAISGGSVSAKTPTSPTTNRFAGADRYETAVKLAREINSVAGGMVIVSGESPWDALSAAPLTTATRPMLLVRSGSVPETVLDFISDRKTDLIGGNDPIYIVGGTSAVSQATADAILAAAKTAGDTLPPRLVRVSGDDRYATSKAVAALTAVTGAADTMMLVNGTSWADAVSASFIAAQNNWPLVLTPGSVTGSAKDAVDAYLALPGSAASFMIVGGPAVMPSAVDEFLVGEGVAPADIRRIGGTDRYHTSLLMNVWAYSYDSDFDGEHIALASGESPWDALTASGWAAHDGGVPNNRVHIQLTPAAGGNTFVNTLSGTLATLASAGLTAKNGNLYVIGGKSAVSDAAKAGYSAVSVSNNLTTTLSGCNEGSTSIVLTFSGNLSAAEQALVNDQNLSANMEKNGVAFAAGDITGVNQLSKSSFSLTVPALADEDEIELLSLVEGVAPVPLARTAVGTSCVVAEDTTLPTATLRAVPGAVQGNQLGDMYFILTASEPIQAPTVSAGRLTVNGVASGAAGVVSAIGTSGTTWLITTGGGENAIQPSVAGGTASLAAAAIVDLANNVALDPVAATFAGDAVAPVLTTVSTVCEADSGAGKQAQFTRGDLVITAKQTSSLGAAGNQFSLVVVNQRGLLIPTVAVDATSKVITITADTGYHVVEDVKTAFANAWLEDPLLGDWVVTTTGASPFQFTATTTPVRSTTGASDCVVTVSSNEAFAVASVGVTATVLGFGAPLVGAVTASGAAAYDATAIGTGLRTSRTFSFETTVLGAGLLNFAAPTGVGTGNGVFDANGNPLLTPLAFTAG